MSADTEFVQKMSVEKAAVTALANLMVPLGCAEFTLPVTVDGEDYLVKVTLTKVANE